MRIYSTVLNKFINVYENTIDYMQKMDILDTDKHDPRHDLLNFSKIDDLDYENWVIFAKNIENKELVPINIVEDEYTAIDFKDYFIRWGNTDDINKFVKNSNQITKEDLKKESNSIIKSYLPEF